MREKQLKIWMQANPKNAPQCYVVSHAGGAQYMVEVSIKNELSPLRDDRTDEVMHFDNVEQVTSKLRRLGFKKAILRLLDPYDEMCSSPSCNEDIVIPI